MTKAAKRTETNLNYLAHGYRFLDDRYRLAGTALPDWLGSAQRRTRVPARLARQWVENQEQDLTSLAHGILQHHDDDAVFHAGPTFNRLCSEFQQRMDGAGEKVNDHVRSLTAHIIIELLLDASLADDSPGLLKEYYEAINLIDADRVSGMVELMTGHPTAPLSNFISIFRSEAFLRDYLTDEGLLHRLSQIIRRARLGELPHCLPGLLGTMRDRVYESAPSLLAGT